MKQSSRSGSFPRAAQRHKTFEPTVMTTAGHEARVHLLNLSQSGALVHGAKPPVVGTAVQLGIDTVACAAQVVWVDGSRFGVAFDRPLDQALLDRFLASVGSAGAVAARATR